MQGPFSFRSDPGIVFAGFCSAMRRPGTEEAVVFDFAHRAFRKRKACAREWNS